jgi:regulator-associated protein of mTOR
MERVLFHYNGHGVPKPTSNGEIWMFNRNFTQYVPVSIYDLHTWMGTPVVFVFDCSGAGALLEVFSQIVGPEHQSSGEVMVIGSCAANQILPMNPSFPADIFTSCLTTPLEMALYWFASQSILCEIDAVHLSKIPGKLNERKTPLGELNWIFTAITDTIAWTSLPHDVFMRLFREDPLVSSLFRNFLLAQRILQSFKCDCVSIPSLPPTFTHPAWDAWDFVSEFTLSQLSLYINDEKHQFQSSSFFQDQLTAFEVWLEFEGQYPPYSKPMHLPIVLQVILSHSPLRLRALALLARFLDKGPWAVELMLSVGMLDYILKLLQNAAPEIRNDLLFIWAKTLAFDKSFRVDLIKDEHHNFFVTHLTPLNVSAPDTSPLQCFLACFVISVLCDNSPQGQFECLNAGALRLLIQRLDSRFAIVRTWVCLALSKLWFKFKEAQKAAIIDHANLKLEKLLNDPIPDVRAAAIYALSSFFGRDGHMDSYDEIQQNRDLCLASPIALVLLNNEGSVIVRWEAVSALSKLVYYQKAAFVAAVSPTPDSIECIEKMSSLEHDNISRRKPVLDALSYATKDPSPEICDFASDVLMFISTMSLSLSSSPLKKEISSPTLSDLGRSSRLGRKEKSLKKSSKSSADMLISEDSKSETSSISRSFIDTVSRDVFKASQFYELKSELLNQPVLAVGSITASEQDDSKSDVGIQVEFSAGLAFAGSFLETLVIEHAVSERNNSIIKDAVGLLPLDDIRPFDNQSVTISTEFEEITSIVFHPFQPLLAINDAFSCIG